MNKIVWKQVFDDILNAWGINPQLQQASIFQKIAQGNPDASMIGPIISFIIPFIYVIAGLILLFNLISAGFKMMTGAADEKGVAEAKARVTNSLTGFIILFLSYWIVQIVEFVLGIQIF